MQNKHLTLIKKEEHDTRSTNIKNICTYFKDSFRIKLSNKGLVEQVAWTLLAEIVLARTQCGNYCTVKAGVEYNFPKRFVNYKLRNLLSQKSMLYHIKSVNVSP